MLFYRGWNLKADLNFHLKNLYIWAKSFTMKFFAAIIFALLCNFTIRAQKAPPEGYEHAPSLSITGDFDGDSKSDTFSQFVTDSLGNKLNFITALATWDENLSTYDRLNYQNAFTLNNKPTVIDNYIAIGLFCLINLGDINNAKGDEIALVPMLLDYSMLNTCRIYSYCKGKWTEIFSFNINESAFTWSADKSEPVFTTIPDALEKRNNEWRFYDYLDMDYENEEQVGQMKQLKVTDCK